MIWWSPELATTAAVAGVVYAGLALWLPLLLLALPLAGAAVREPIRLAVSTRRTRQRIAADVTARAAAELEREREEAALELEVGTGLVYAAAERLDELAIEPGGSQ